METNKKMKYAFCIAEDINLGCGYVMSHLRSQGHDVKLFFEPNQFNRGYSRIPLMARLLSLEKYNIRKIKQYKPDVCCFSCVTATYQWALGMAEKVKKEVGCKVIFGGVHPTLVPDEVRQHKFIDEVIIGDGVSHFGGKFNPDKLWPDRESFLKELPPEHRRTQLFISSIGCPFNCSYCGNQQLREVGQYDSFRRMPANCIEELEHLKSIGMKYVLFADDIFMSDKTWLLNFIPLYKEYIKLPFTCFGHPKFIKEDTVKMLKDAGCHTIWMGIQTGHEFLRKEVLNRKETNQEIIDASKIIKDAGIKLMVDHIFGIPGESNTTNDVSYTLYKHIEPDVVNCYQLLYFPKAKIISHAIRHGLLTPLDIKKIEEGKGITYQVGNQGQHFYNTYAKGMITVPLRYMFFELLPDTIIKLIVHIRAGRGFIAIVVLQNEIYFTVKAILKKLRIL